MRRPLRSLELLSRRGFLRLAGLGLLAAAQITGCSGPAARRAHGSSATATPPAPATATLAPTALPPPSATPAPSPTPFDEPLLDERTLSRVAVALDPAVTAYPLVPPFDPAEAYPESPFPPASPGGANGAYALVRQALRAFHPEGYGEPGWNPLASMIRPGDTVLIKPNLVDATHWRDGQTTHPALIRAVVDYVFLACGPGGQIAVGDGPWKVGLFGGIAESTGLRATVEHLVAEHGTPVSLVDLDDCPPQATPEVDLGELSALRGVERRWFDAHHREMDPAAAGRYRIASPVLQADVVVSVPKVKVHSSGGLTLNLKNALGTIPSWDGYADGQLKDCPHTSDLDRAGGKRGEYLENDTLWRSLADLNRILLYAGREGRLRPERQRRYLAIVDGVVAAEASQYQPRPRPLGAVIVGADPASVDAVAARVAGFDPRRLRTIAGAASVGAYALGPSDPAGIRLALAGVEVLQAHCTRERAIVPESQVYDWRGQVEAGDFDPPHLEWRFEAKEERLVVRAEDAAGVAWVRVACRRLGEPRVVGGALMSGDPTTGEWSIPLPAFGQLDEIWLEACDALFNARRVPVGI